MPKTVLIKLTTAGPDTGPFDLYCVNSLGNIVGPPFENNVPKALLVAGYVSILVPDTCNIIRVKSDNQVCTNFVDLVLPTTTTTTSSSTTTSTTSSPTTTSTTTVNLTTSTSSTTSTTTRPATTTSTTTQPTSTTTSSSTTTSTSTSSTSTTSSSTTSTTTVQPTTTSSTSTSTTTSTTSSTTTSTSSSTTSTTTIFVPPIVDCCDQQYNLRCKTYSMTVNNPADGGGFAITYVDCQSGLTVGVNTSGQVQCVCASQAPLILIPGNTAVWEQGGPGCPDCDPPCGCLPTPPTGCFCDTFGNVYTTLQDCQAAAGPGGICNQCVCN